MTAQPLRTPLYDWHASQGARIVDFGGWAMPVLYTSIVDEHNATRMAAGLFDISHMGRLSFTGDEAAKFLDCMVTRRVADMRPGQIRYALACNGDGGILDDVLVYRYAAGTTLFGGAEWGLVVNAGNTPKMIDWLKDRQIEFAARLHDHTPSTAMIALQGPLAMRHVATLAEFDPRELKYYTGRQGMVAGATSYISRTGYTGEDGVEIILPAADAPRVWQQLIDTIVPEGGRAVGLGARDTLRLEAGMPLYGHELDEQTNPVEAGLDFALSLEGRDFVGRDAIVAARAAGPQRVRVGLQLDGRRPAREGATVLVDTHAVGQVTSGTFSPTFNKPLAMAYVKPTDAAIGTIAMVDIRGNTESATIVPLPFYKRGG